MTKKTLKFAKHCLGRHPRLFFLAARCCASIKRLVSWIPGARRSCLRLSREDGLLRIDKQGHGGNGSGSRDKISSFDAEYQDEQDFSSCQTDLKAIAYYLPQFHQTDENDEWWGEGFTEWTNTRKTKPLFDGHYQPREPHDDIGYYDLSDVNVLKEQVEMARRHGIYGFCFYYYWFHGRRLLDKPLDMLLDHPEIDIPFCLCWANETWSRKWDGHDHHILMEQTFSDEDDIAFIESLSRYMKDERYIRIDSKPVVMVYRIFKLPDAKATARRWRDWCRDNGIGEIYLLAVFHGEVVWPTLRPAEDYGFDAYASFPPHNFACSESYSEGKELKETRLADYQDGVEKYDPDHDVKVYEGCMLGWDNTARLGSRAYIWLRFSLPLYYQWLCKTIEYTRRTFSKDERFLFINAWNEWAEGAYLEPDKKYGYAYLNTTSKALFGLPPDERNAEKEDE
jgi:lipopolysaccharide biosynthesis protein